MQSIKKYLIKKLMKIKDKAISEFQKQIDSISKNSFYDTNWKSYNLELIKLYLGQQSIFYTDFSKWATSNNTKQAILKVVGKDEFLKIQNVQAINILQNCISFLDANGVNKTPNESKNILGNLDNSMVWTLAAALTIASFFLGVFTMKFGLAKYFDPTENRENVQSTIQTQILKDTLKVEEVNKIHNNPKIK